MSLCYFHERLHGEMGRFARYGHPLSLVMIDLDGRTRNITGSFGVATFEKGLGPESFIKRVDDAVYEAKNSGRNRVVVAKAQGTH